MSRVSGTFWSTILRGSSMVEHAAVNNGDEDRKKGLRTKTAVLDCSGEETPQNP